MRDFRGRWSLGFALVVALTSACGSSDDDSSGAFPGFGGAKSGAGGGDSKAGSGARDTGGTTATAGKSASGGSGATGAKGGTTGSGGTSGGAAGTGTAKGGTGTGTGGSATDGGETATGDGGASATSDLLDAIGAACKQDCDAQFALDCAPTTSNSLTCQLSCATTTTQLGDFCLEEYRDYVQCRADGGYDCVSGAPYQRSTCAVEQLAFSQCTQHIGCKRFCEKTQELGCNDTPFDTCLADCTTPDPTLPSTCAYETETIATCQATSSKACDGDALEMPAACESSVLEVASCIDENGSSGYCDAWCWASDKLGCGPADCATDCATKTADTTCGSQWTSLLDCVLFFGDGMCSADGLTIAGNGICDSEQSEYQTCVQGAAGAPAN